MLSSDDDNTISMCYNSTMPSNETTVADSTVVDQCPKSLVSNTDDLCPDDNTNADVELTEVELTDVAEDVAEDDAEDDAEDAAEDELTEDELCKLVDANRSLRGCLVMFAALYISFAVLCAYASVVYGL